MRCICKIKHLLSSNLIGQFSTAMVQVYIYTITSLQKNLYQKYVSYTLNFFLRLVLRPKQTSKAQI